MTVALYPGSFDPIHHGHIGVIAQAAALFDHLIIGVGHNPDKPSGLFTPDERVALIRGEVDALPNVSVELFSGLVTAAARNLSVDCLVKGLRGSSDLDVEMQQAHMNLTTGSVPTVFIPGTGAAALVAGTYVRQIAAAGGDISEVVPGAVAAALEARFSS